MIKKSVLFLLAFLLFHATYIVLFPSSSKGTHQWQENQIKAQHFLYGGWADTVMIGTSLSARIIPESIPSVKSCSFSACVVEDGLRLILSKDEVPHYVLLETNYFFRPSNEELLRSNTKGIMPRLRKYFPSLQERFSPICLVCEPFMRNALAPSEIVDTIRLNKNIESRIAEDCNRLLSETEVNQRVKTLKHLIRKLESYGTKIVLFEMPLNDRLRYLPSNEQTRKVIWKMFPPSHYLYLPNDTSHYLTNDGEHLDAKGQRRYSQYFKHLLDSISI